ncbi:MAG: iron-sulfur cluster assembly accessory protein [Planctomycetaceae bacterium]|nr:iron-sulfur cluster assembly accessory protein [Planctomycetaceae bacterium]
MVHLSEEAATEIKRRISECSDPENTVLRVGVRGGGCSGFDYLFGFDTNVDAEKDHVTEQHGVKIAVQKAHDLYLDGTKIGFKNDLDKYGFTFDNPNATRTCGCGSSFGV